MVSSLYELLHDCTVKVAVSGEHKGTGFFVAPGLILTCAHVIEAAYQTENMPVEISWRGQVFPAQIHEFRDASYPDLALLQAKVPDHPCVLLHGGAEPHHQLYSYGYARNESQGASTTFNSEGWAGSQQEFLKFKAGQVSPGMSGSPVLNEQTGSVCAIIQFTYDSYAALGGKAILTKIIFQEFKGLEAQQRQFHQQDRRWANCLTAQQRQKLGLDEVTDAIEVFFSYHPNDSKQRDELGKHLKQMRREKLITDWYMGNVQAGVDEKEEAKKHLDTAHIILMLVSPDFLDSDYHYDVEMARALQRHKVGEARVIPILLRDTTGWDKTDFGGLVRLPRDGRPVSKYADKDEAFANIAREIRRVVEQLKTPKV